MEIKRSLKGYELREQIGTGSSGVVYRAYQTSVGREVAIKMILPQYANDPEFIRRFEVEAQLIARLEHPHIVPLIDYWRDPEGAYLVMRWLPLNLRTAIKRAAWSPAATARLLEQLADSLAVAHRENVIHRDIKPENILLDEDQNAYLSDFSIARDLSLWANAENQDYSTSPAYISPEQIQHEPLTPRTDIYALGIVIYELLTGVRATANATSPEEYLHWHLHTALSPVHSRYGHLPAALDEVLATATAKDPTHRYANVRRFAAAFRAALPVTASRTLPQPLPEPLTEREQEVLRWIVADLTNEQIAQRLVLSRSTVKWYVKQIYSKLDTHSRLQTIERAHHLNLVQSSTTTRALGKEVAAGYLSDRADASGSELVNPFKGLRAFQEADQANFFGRASVVERLLNRLSEREARLLVLIGPSGSGKSSLIKAGLLPALRQGALTSSPHPFVAEMVPGTHPLEELEAAVLRVSVNPLPGLLEQVHQDRRGLVRAVKRILPTDPESELFLVIDQFEELFMLVPDENTRQQFIENLLSAISDARGRVRVLVTLRADFYDRPLMYPRLAEWVRLHTEVLTPLTAREMEQAIVAPLDRIGVRLEEGLLATIIHDVSEQPGALPLLQYALTELFEHRDGPTLTLEAYHQTGGVLGALSRRADSVYNHLDGHAQELARQVFLRLVTLGEGTEDTRRRSPLTELVSLDNESTIEDMINSFTGYRLLTLDRDPLTHTPTVDIAHEALIRTWGKLHDWLAESRDDVRIQRGLAQSTAEWTKGDESFLATGTRLTQLENWAAQTKLTLTGAERSFLDASLARRAQQQQDEQERQTKERQLERRSRHVLRVLVMVLLAATVGALGLTSSAVTSASVAATQQSIAEANFDRAEQQRLYLASNEAMNNGASGNVGMALALRSLAYGYSASADAALLRATRHGIVVRRLAGHQSELNDVTYSPDGKLIATASNAGTRLYDAQTGEELLLLPGENNIVEHALFDPSSRLVVTSRIDGLVQVWDSATGEERDRIIHDSRAKVVGFTSMGNSFYTLQWPRTVREWDLYTGELRARWELDEDVYRFRPALQLAPTGFMFVTSENVLKVQDLETSEVFCQIEIPDDVVDVSTVELSPDGQTLVFQYDDESVYVWDMASCSEAGRYTIHAGFMTEIVFSTDGETVFTSDSHGRVFHWDLKTGQILDHYFGSNAQGLLIALSPDEQFLITGGSAPEATIFDLRFPSEPRLIYLETLSAWRVRFMADGDSISVGGPLALERLNLRSESPIWQSSLDMLVRDFAYSPDEQSVFMSTQDDFALNFSNYLLDTVSGEIVREFEGHTQLVNHVAYSPDGTRVASGSWDGTARVWDAATAEEQTVFTGHTDVVSHVMFSSDSATILSTSLDGTAQLWHVDTGEVIQRFVHNSGITAGVFSPDGSLVVTTDMDGIAHLWSIQTGQKRYELRGHTAALWAAQFSADGQYIATSGDGVRLWDTQSGKLLRVLPEQENGSNTWPAFSADGQILLVGSLEQNQVTLWRLSLPEVIEMLCDRPWLDVTPEERAQYGILDNAPTCSASRPAGT